MLPFYLRRQLDKFLKSNLPRYFLRSTESKPAVWCTPEANVDELVKLFIEDSDECSVYLLERPEKEGLLLASHSTSFRRQNVQDSQAILILESDVLEAGLVVKRSPGDVGISISDSVHHDLSGSFESFKQLARIIHNRIKNGESRYRLHRSATIGLHLKYILDSNEIDKEEAAISNLKRALKIPI